MATWVAGLIVTGEIICDGCGRSMKHPERYAYVCEEEQPALRLCEDCSRARGYLKPRRDEKGREVESYL
jgi:sulfur relay (sulfurtransferase) complex TusBCD TusD component (DsrE family)